MNALRILAVVAGFQAQLDMLREELEKEAGIERRPRAQGLRSGMPAMFGRTNPDDARERNAGLQRLHEAAGSAPTADINPDTPKE